ncbi:MAG: hypothetical protein AAGH60_12380 [Pseudomonadota bacterium]
MMSGTSLSIIFDPHLPAWAIIALGLAAAIVLGFSVIQRRRGSVYRLIAVAIVLVALLEPSLRVEDTELQPTVVALVDDRSGSQDIGVRRTVTDDTIEALTNELEALEGVDVRAVTLDTDRELGTLATAPVQLAVADVPRDQIGAVIMVTDGQITDAGSSAPLGPTVPVHTLLSGEPDESDRRVELLQIPRFAIIDAAETAKFRVIEDGPSLTADGSSNAEAGARGSVGLSILRNNELLAQTQVPIGVDIEVPLTVERAGENTFEVQVHGAENELTLLNNQAVFTVEGVRDTLRVLLVSGQPHAGERTWRNLLKSDPAVDLVHFTILRPPEKQDGTPISELSLIAFPTRELFVERINDFDLIILDRYQRRSVLPLVYFDNIADYVRRGGALLVAAGPEFADTNSIAFTSLADVLPAYPTGIVSEEPYRPRLSELGRRHPITRGLPGASVGAEEESEPEWSRWFRLIEAEAVEPSVVALRAPQTSALPGAPVLALNKIEDGRVALFLSDHAWLWARNFEGGGPHVQLLRRMAHWLMQEPDLEDETLRADVRDGELLIERRTLQERVGEALVTSPSGTEIQVSLEPRGDGLYRGSVPAAEIGLWRISEADLNALAHVGSENPIELQRVVATTSPMDLVAEATGGSVHWLSEREGGEPPSVRLVSQSARASGSNWIGIRQTNASILTGAREQPLSLGLWSLLPALFFWGFAWWREGR